MTQTKTFRSDFLALGQGHELADQHGLPLFVYSRGVLERQAQAMLSVPAPYGLTVRFAMKANPNPEVLTVLREAGIAIDASSGYEAAYALEQGFAAEDILLTSQELAHNLEELVGQGVQFNATSLHQLEAYGQAFPDSDVSIRLNPGIGSGFAKRTTVGGVASSFGIWHEYIPQAQAIAERYNLRVVRVHTHIGSGTDPDAWREASQVSLELMKHFPDATTINLGGGFKVARMDDEKDADMRVVGTAIAEQVAAFRDETGRELHLELEPGTFMTANAGMLLAAIDDIVDTGAEGYTFVKLNTGMNDIVRPSMYGSQHPIAVLNEANEQQDYIVVGHNCESGDILTPAPGDSEALLTRRLNRAEIGDLVIIGGTGAYCKSMALHGYNGFPDTAEVLVD